LAALSTVLAKQGEQGLLLAQCGFQFDQIAITQRCKLLINKLKELAGYADIVGQLLKHCSVMHVGTRGGFV
jgi:hypothetical protein